MKSKIVTALFLSLILIGTFGVKKSWGTNCLGSVTGQTPDPIVFNAGQTFSVTFTITSSADFLNGQQYNIVLSNKQNDPYGLSGFPWSFQGNGTKSKTTTATGIYFAGPFSYPGTYYLSVWHRNSGPENGCIVSDSPVIVSTGYGSVSLHTETPQLQIGQTASFKASGLEPNTNYCFWWEGDWGCTVQNSGSTLEMNFTLPGKNDAKSYFACIVKGEATGDCGGNPFSAKSDVPVQFGLGNATPYPTLTPIPTCPAGVCPTSPPTTISPTGNSPFDPCKNLAGTEMGRCRACTGIDDKGQFNITSKCDPKQFSNIGASCGTWTSLGCIPNDPPNLVGWIITLASGVAGGIAFLLILFGSFQIVTSGGVPEKIAGGKDIITSALIGLLFIFLSVLILKVIGVQILGIPGWT